VATVQFDELQVYQVAEQLADQIWEIVRKWDILARDTVGKQLIRSADSIGANIAEGCGRQSYRDNQRFVRIARGSLNETRHWLRLAYRRGLLTETQVVAIKPIMDSLPKRLNAYLRSIGPPRERSNCDAQATDHGLRTMDQ
jgi:four helix bundle protein